MPKQNGLQSGRGRLQGSSGPAGFEEGGPEQEEQSASGVDRQDSGRIEQMIERNPLSAVLTGFGLGLGFGLTVTLLISRQRQQTWWERNLPESLSHLPDRFKHVPESLTSHLPTSWKRS
jgi:hypothetical protein